MFSKSKLNFSKIFLGHMGAQIISFAFYPILTRLYGPGDFGVFGFFNSVVQVAAIYSTGQFHVGMLAQKADQDIKELYSLSIYLNFLVSVLLFFLFFFLYSMDQLDSIYLLLPLGVLLYGSFEVNKNWSVSRDVLGYQGIIVNVNRLASNLLKLLGHSPITLILSELVANGIGNILFLKKSYRDLLRFDSLARLKEIIWRHKQFPVFFTFYVLSQVLSSEAVTIYLKRYLDSSEVGVFFLANKLFVQTALIVSSSLSLAFNHQLIEGQQARVSLYVKVMKCYAAGILISLLLWFPNYSPFIELLFGQKWTELGTVINFFFFLSPVKVFTGFCAYMVLLSGRMKFIAFFKIVQFITLFVALQLGFSDLQQFLMIFVPLEVVFDSIFIAWGFYLVKRSSST